MEKPQAQPASSSPSADSEPNSGVVIVIFSIALVLRLALFIAGPSVDIQRAMYPDSPRYIELANNMLRFGTFGKATEDAGVVHIGLARLRGERGELSAPDANGLRPEVFRTPGYPLVLAALFAMGLSVGSVLVLQCALGAATVSMVHLIASKLTGSRAVGALAAVLLALHPADVLACNSVLSETLFTAMMTAGIAMLVLPREKSALMIAGAGMVLGLAVLVRPQGVFVGPCLAMWLIVAVRSWRSVPLALLLIVASLAAPLGWMARNRAVGEGFRLSSVQSLSSLYYTAAFARILNPNASGDTVEDWPPVVNQLHARLRREVRAGESTLAAADRLAFIVIMENRAGYVEAMKRSAIKFVMDHSTGSLWNTLGHDYKPTGLRDKLLRGEGFSELLASPATTVSLLWTLYNAAIALLALVGVIVLLWRRRLSAAVLLAGLFLYFLVTTQTSGLERFRMPAIGTQAIAAACVLLVRRDRASDALAPSNAPA